MLLNYYLEKAKFTKKFAWAPNVNVFSRDYLGDKENTKHKIKKSGSKEIKQLDTEIDNFMIRKNHKVLNKVQRKVKSVCIYDLRKIGGRVVKLFKRVRKIQHFKQYCGINKTNRITGFTPFYIGFRRSRPVNFNNIYNDFFFENFTEIKNRFPNIYKDLIKSASDFREVYSGSPDSNFNHLKRFLQDDVKQELSLEEKIGIVLKGGWIKSPQLRFRNSSEMIFSTNFNPKATNGLLTSRFLKDHRKSSSIFLATQLAIKKFDMIREKPFKNYSIWELFSREKEFSVSKETMDKEISTRVVLSTEHHETILLSWVFQSFMTAYESFNKDKSHFYIKGELDGDKATKIINRIKNYDYYVDADWASFDSSIPQDDLIVAGVLMFANSIERNGDHFNKQDLRFVFHVISSFVTKYIAVPPGIVIEVNRGNPSGHPGVTAVNCVCNLIRWSLIGFGIYGPGFQDKMDVIVYGDDAIVAFKESPNLINIDKIIKNLNYESEELYDKLYPVSLIENSIFEGPDFLKRRFNNNGIVWNLKKVFDKMLYQSKNRSVYDQLVLLSGYQETGPSSEEFNEFCKFTFSKLKSNFKEGTIEHDYCKNYEPVIKDQYNLNITKDTLNGYKTILNIVSESIELYLPSLKEKYIDSKLGWDIATYRRLIFNELPPTLINENSNVVRKLLTNVKIGFLCVNKHGIIFFNKEYFNNLFNRVFRRINDTS